MWRGKVRAIKNRDKIPKINIVERTIERTTCASSQSLASLKGKLAKSKMMWTDRRNLN